MIGKSDPLSDYFGHTGSSWHDLLPNIVARAVKAGFTVVLLQPDSDYPACTATDRARLKEDTCWHPLEPQDNPAKVRPMVTSAIRRVTERYGGTPNVAIDLGASAKVLELPQADGLLVVPPSIVAGEAVTLQEVLANRGLN